MNEDIMKEARELAAQCWCDPETEHLTMIPELAEAIAKRFATLMEAQLTVTQYAVDSVIQGLLGASISIVSRLSGRPEGPELQNLIIDGLNEIRAPESNPETEAQLDAVFQQYMDIIREPFGG